MSLRERASFLQLSKGRNSERTRRCRGSAPSPIRRVTHTLPHDIVSLSVYPVNDISLPNLTGRNSIGNTRFPLTLNKKGLMFEELTAARRHSFHTSPYLLRKLGTIDQTIWTVSLGALNGRRMQGRKS